MADTYSSYLKVLLAETGSRNNSWGAALNTDALNLLDSAIAGRSTINVGAGTTYSLAALANGAASEARAMVLSFTGAPASALTVTVPGTVTSKIYLVKNAVGKDLIMTYGGAGTTVTIPTGTMRVVVCDGVNCETVYALASDAASLSGVFLAQLARIDTSNIFTGGRNSHPFITVTEGPTTTIDASKGNNFILTLTGNRVLAAPNPAMVDGQWMKLVVVQDGVGGRSISSWNAIYIFENGATPTFSSAPGGIDEFDMVYNQALNKIIVRQAKSVSTPSGASYALTISENTTDWNLLARVGTLGSPATITVTVNQGVVVQSLSPLSPALDLSGLPAGSTVNLLNYGYVLGRGGRGGKGAGVHDSGSAKISILDDGENGRPGGVAVIGPGVGRTFNVTNANGRIWGGGGGGGGGGISGSGAAGSVSAGGGGAGAGGAEGGLPGAYTQGLTENPGVGSASGINSVRGSGAASTPASGPFTGAAGGDGGDWGADGAAGGAGATLAPGSGGTAGKAIELSGGAITFISGSGSPNVKGAVS